MYDSELTSNQPAQQPALYYGGTGAVYYPTFIDPILTQPREVAYKVCVSYEGGLFDPSIETSTLA